MDGSWIPFCAMKPCWCGPMIVGPAGQQVRAVGRCEIAFPQEKGVGGKMIIFAFEVDKLEELYETPYGGLERWHLQLGEEHRLNLQARLLRGREGCRPQIFAKVGCSG